MVSSVQSERIRLEQEVQGNYADILSDVNDRVAPFARSRMRMRILQESQYFMLNCQASINQARMEQGTFTRGHALRILLMLNRVRCV